MKPDNVEDSDWKSWADMLWDKYRLKWKDLEACTISKAKFHQKFDSSYGSANGAPFTAWTKDRVFGNHDYDGADEIIALDRHPKSHSKEN